MIRILLAEDQLMVRQGLKMMIESDEGMEVVGEANNGKEAIQICEKQAFDIAILDIRMPEMDGIETAKVIQQEPDPSLTPRERDILTCIGEGLSNGEIAERLAISVGTVKNNTSQILNKLGLRDRTQLAIYAIRHNLV